MSSNATVPHQIRHLIDGELVGQPEQERRNPAQADDIVSLSARGTGEEVEAAVTAAQRAQTKWVATPPPHRGAILYRAAELLDAKTNEVAKDLTREEGKTIAEARGEVQRAVGVLRYYGGEGWRLFGETIPSATSGTLVFTKREPLGVVGVLTPWNFPIAIPAWKMSPALVSGNSVVFKPASLTAVSAHHLVNTLCEAGLPPGVVNVVYGSGDEVGNAIVNDRRVAAVTFTGSSAVGQSIHQKVSSRMGRVQLEMGGKNPLVILDDADVQQAAHLAASGGFGLTGQTCTATSRVIATPDILEPFVTAIKEKAYYYQPGNGLDENTLMGPVVSDTQLGTDCSYVEIASQEGGELIFGGEPIDGLRFPPTLIGAVRPNHRIAMEEVFGPIIAVIEAQDFDNALAIANDVPYGLAAGICTHDLQKAHVFADRVQAGVVKVNRPTTGLDLNVPFGGIKASSTGTYREQGAVAVDFFTRSKSVYLGYES